MICIPNWKLSYQFFCNLHILGFIPSSIQLHKEFNRFHGIPELIVSPSNYDFIYFNKSGHYLWQLPNILHSVFKYCDYDQLIAYDYLVAFNKGMETGRKKPSPTVHKGSYDKFSHNTTGFSFIHNDIVCKLRYGTILLANYCTHQHCYQTQIQTLIAINAACAILRQQMKTNTHVCRVSNRIYSNQKLDG